MEVLHRSSGPVLCGLPANGRPAGAVMYPPGLQRVFMSPADVYSCYPFEANTPSRTPTPEHPGPRGKQGPPMDFSSQATTLQSVLRGEIPAAYSHLASSSSSQNHRHAPSSIYSASSRSNSSSSPSSPTSTVSKSSSLILPQSMDVDHHRGSSSSSQLHNPPPLLFHPANTPSPCPSHLSSTHSCYSPRPQSRPLSHESHESDMQTEPMDLSYKSPMTTSSKNKASRKRTAVSAFLDVASNSQSTSLLSSSLPAKFNTSTRALSAEHLSSCSPVPTSSSSSSSMHSFPPSPGEGQHGGEEFSLLRNLLSVGKHSQQSSTNGLSSSTPNLTSPPSPIDPLSSSRSCDSPASDLSSSSSLSNYQIRAPVNGNTRVQLAKKNLLPITARVSDWLDKSVKFAKSIPEFSNLSEKDQTILVTSSWAKLVLLYMAESNFQFVVTPHHSSNSMSDLGAAISQDEPTMKSVEGIQTFIRKCQQMHVDAREYEFLRMLVLFNAGYPGLSSPSSIDQLNSVVQQLLQQHVRVSKPSDVMHYSRLLMCLPSLFGTNSRMFENLFCKNVGRSSVDMDTLLKELLNTVS